MSIQFASSQPDTDTPHESLKPDSSAEARDSDQATSSQHRARRLDGFCQTVPIMGWNCATVNSSWAFSRHRPHRMARPLETLFHLAGSLGSLSLPGTALLSQNSKADECTERLSFPFAESAERLGFSFTVEAKDGVSRPLVDLLDAQLLATCCRLTYRQATACQNRNQGIHPSSSPCSRQPCQWVAGAKGEVPWDNQPNSTGQDNRPPTSVRSHGVFVVVDGPRSVPCRPSGRSHPPIREQLPNWQLFPLVALRREEVYDASASAYDFPVPEIHSLAFIYGCCSAGRKVAFLPCIGGSVFGTIQALSCDG